MALADTSYKASEFVSVFFGELLAHMGLTGLIACFAGAWFALTIIFWIAMKVGAPGNWSHLARGLGLANLFVMLLGGWLFVEVAGQFFLVEQPEREGILNLLLAGFRLLLVLMLLALFFLGIQGQSWRRVLGWVVAGVGLALLCVLTLMLAHNPMERLQTAQSAWSQPGRLDPWEPEWLKSEEAIWFYQVRLARWLQEAALQWQEELAREHRRLMATRQVLDETDSNAIRAFNVQTAKYGQQLHHYQNRLKRSAGILNDDTAKQLEFAKIAAPEPLPFIGHEEK